MTWLIFHSDEILPLIWKFIFMFLGKDESNFKKLENKMVYCCRCCFICASQILWIPPFCQPWQCKKFGLMPTIHSMWWLVGMMIHCSIFVSYIINIINKSIHRFTGLEISCNKVKKIISKYGKDQSDQSKIIDIPFVKKKKKLVACWINEKHMKILCLNLFFKKLVLYKNGWIISLYRR